MLLSIFSPIYEAICGANRSFPEYREQIFNAVGLLTLVSVFLTGLLFYLVLGRWRMIWFNIVHWSITIVICGIAGFTLAFCIAKNALGLVDGYLWLFASINTLYAALYFIIISFLLKQFSVFSRRTPI